MFGFGKKKKSENMNIDLNKVDLSNSNDFQTFSQRYEYTVKVFDKDEHGRPLTHIQKAYSNSDTELAEIFGMCDQQIQILEKREVNPPSKTQQTVIEQNINIPKNQNGWTTVTAETKVEPVHEPVIKYFSCGGIDFKMVDQEVYQKQWVMATDEECQKIRIINDKTNKIVPLDGKHIEVLHWVKVDSTDQV